MLTRHFHSAVVMRAPHPVGRPVACLQSWLASNQVRIDSRTSSGRTVAKHKL